MLKPVILDSDVHTNGKAESFKLAIVDDPNDGETKLVVMFDTPGHIAVLSLDCLINEEDISRKCHESHGDKLEEDIRQLLGGTEG